MRIYIHSHLNSDLREKIRNEFGGSDQLTFRAETSDESAREAFLGSDVVLGNPPADWFGEKPADGLRFWQLESAGFDQYRKIETNAQVANMGDWFARPCAETIVGGVLALLRGLDQLVLLQSKKEWIGAAIRQTITTLFRKKVVVLGAGSIGTAVQDILSGFACEVLLMARSSSHAELHTREELYQELLSTDIVINTLPGSAHHFVNRELLYYTKKGAIYANVGRGSNTDEAALTEALQSRHLKGAVLDVTETEPLPDDHVFWSMPNVLLTQHSGGGQADEDTGKADIFLVNMHRLIGGEPVQYAINLHRGY